MTETVIRAENPQAESIWAPRLVSGRGWICERKHYGNQGALKGVETWGAYTNGPDGNRRFCVGYFPLEENASANCETLNAEGVATLEGDGHGRLQ